MELVLVEKEQKLEKMEDRLSLHDQMTYVTAMHAFRYINSVLKNANGDGTKADMCEWASDIVHNMLDATYSRDLYNKADEKRYKEILSESNDFILAAVKSGLIQTADEGEEPDRELLRIVNHVGAMGQRMTEKMLDFKENELPIEYARHVSLDKVCSRYGNLISAGKITRKIREDDFRSVQDYELREFAGNLTRYSALDAMKAAAEARRDCYVDFPNSAAENATRVLDHIIAGMEEENDEAKSSLYYRSVNLVKSMKDALLSEDMLSSAEKHFDSAMYEYYAMIAKPEERANLEEAMKDLTASDSENAAMEFDMTLEKLNAYKRILDDTNELMRDISGHELLNGNGSSGRPDMHLLFTVQQLNHMAHWIDRSADLLQDALINPKIASYDTAYEPKAKLCSAAWINVKKSVIESDMLHQATSEIANYHGEIKGKMLVLKERVESRVFDDVLEIIRAGGPDVEQKINKALSKTMESAYV